MRSPAPASSGVSRWVRRDALTRRTMDGMVVLVPDGSPTTFNSSAAEVWDVLERPQTIETICDRLSASHVVDGGVLENDVIRTLAELTALGLVVRHDGPYA